MAITYVTNILFTLHYDKITLHYDKITLHYDKITLHCDKMNSCENLSFAFFSKWTDEQNKEICQTSESSNYFYLRPNVYR